MNENLGHRESFRKLLVFPGLVGSRKKVPLSEALRRLIIANYINREIKHQTKAA